jgi:hypothetical protein
VLNIAKLPEQAINIQIVHIVDEQLAVLV